MTHTEAIKKAEALAAQMTIDEKCSQLRYDAPPVKQLDIPAYNWWNEGLHGCARAGTATVFPQAIAIAAAFDETLTEEIAEITALETRAKYNSAVRHKDRDIYKGLTLWSPNVNIFRDPRWGRGHETFGEDPCLTSKTGRAFVRGIQKKRDGYYTAAACAKHFAVHSGPEEIRHEFDAQVSQKDLHETYLRAFKELTEEGVLGFMGAYNRVNGEPACGSPTLDKLLRTDWGFKGYFVSDCWAVQDFHAHHKITATPVESAALALNNGCDVNCGCTYLNVLNAYNEGLVTEERITEAVVRLFTVRYLLGMHEKTPLDHIPYSINDCAEHKKAALEAAEKSMVLLKNNGILPLDINRLESIAIIGPNADSRSALIGNYHGTASEYVTVLDGIRRTVGDKCRIYYSEGCPLAADRAEGLAMSGDRISEALECAENADVTILVLGLDETLEGEEGDTGNQYFSGDKKDLLLPESQRILLEKITAVGKPVIIVCAAGSALNIDDSKADAYLYAWYGGEYGGLAAADILFGKTSPSGKLPVTFYKSAELLPDFCDYSMKGRTYRYADPENILYPFGYGLTYSKVICTDMTVTCNDNTLSVNITAENIGQTDTDDVIELYFDTDSTDGTPYPSLCGYKKIHLHKGEKNTFTLKVKATDLYVYSESGEGYIDNSASYKLYSGTSQPDKLSRQLTDTECIEQDITEIIRKTGS